MFYLLLNLLGYYIVWFACIISASYNNTWLGLATSIIITSIQSYFFLRKHQTYQLIRFIFTLSTVGFIIDSLLLHFNFFSFKANPFSPWLAAPWLIGLWINFAFILHAFVRHYFKYYWPIGVIAFFGFPLAYYAGVLLGAANLPRGLLGLAILAIIWSIVLPTLLYFFRQRRVQ